MSFKASLPKPGSTADYMLNVVMFTVHVEAAVAILEVLKIYPYVFF